MRAARLYAPGDLRLHDEVVPTPGQDESLVKVTAVGLCGSDLHWFSEASIGDAILSRPLVLGHEFAGVVESGGLLGTRVAVDPAIPCLVCEFCRGGNPNLCTALRFAGHGEQDGALRQSLAWPTRCLVPIPDSMTDVEAALLEPLGVAIHAIDLGGCKPGATVGVFGCGPIGLLLLQIARAAGAGLLIATDKLEHRLRAAEELGAQVAKVSNGRENEMVMKLSGGRGVDVAFEAAGENEAVETAIFSACPGGKVVLVGIPSDDRTAFSAGVARRKGLTIKLCRRMKFTYPRAIRLVERGSVDLLSIATHSYPLDEVERAFEVAQSREGIKVMVLPNPAG